MSFLSWNNVLAKHFFKAEQAGRRVFLFCTEQLIKDLGTQYGNALSDDFISALRIGPSWTPQGHNICRKAYGAWNGWRARDLEYPPYIGYLCFFVMAAGHEGEFHQSSYYPRMRDLLSQEPQAGTYPYFYRMLELWDDLEQWSLKEKEGTLGIFQVFVQGQKIHIGVPLSQTFLTQEERASLPEVFMKSAFDPIAFPSDQEMLSGIFHHGRGHLRPSTLGLLDPQRSINNDLRTTLIEIFREELFEWDGKIVGPAHESSMVPNNAYLVICCDNIKHGSNRASFHFRIRSKEPMPDDGLNLLDEEDLTFHCKPSVFPWSRPIHGLNLALNGNHTLKAQGWCCRFFRRSVHILVSGKAQGIPGFVSVNRLPMGREFFLLVHSSVQHDVTCWGEKNCDAFVNLQIDSGLPEDWEMYKADALRTHAEAAPVDLGMLGPPLNAGIRFSGGLRVSQGNIFFIFSPPGINIEGILGRGCLYINDDRIKSLEGCINLSIPEKFLCEGSQRVAVKFGDQKIQRRISFVGKFHWRQSKPNQTFDEFGNLFNETSPDVPSVAGAIVQGCEVSVFSFNTLLGVSEHRRVFFVGRSPGEVVSWPTEPLPDSWSPIWAIPMERRGTAIFCGDDIDAADPELTISQESHANKRWKQILWHRRCRIKSPSNPVIKSLWKKYQNAAKKI